MLQGGIEDGEDPQSAAMRELQEETGVVSAATIAEVSLLILLKRIHIFMNQSIYHMILDAFFNVRFQIGWHMISHRQ